MCCITGHMVMEFVSSIDGYYRSLPPELDSAILQGRIHSRHDVQRTCCSSSVTSRIIPIQIFTRVLFSLHMLRSIYQIHSLSQCGARFRRSLTTDADRELALPYPRLGDSPTTYLPSPSPAYPKQIPPKFYSST